MEIKLPLTTGQFIGLQIYDQDNDVIAVGSTPECARFIRDRVNAYDRLVSALTAKHPKGAYMSHPAGVHLHECPAWRHGKRHGPCICGADELTEAFDAVLASLATPPINTEDEA